MQHQPLCWAALLVVVIPSALSLIQWSQVSNWNWIVGDPKGPDNWRKIYPQCGSDWWWQSPVDIPLLTTSSCEAPLHWENRLWPQNNITLQNAWRYGALLLDRNYPIVIGGGPLPPKIWYYFAALCIAIGKQDGEGSADLIRGDSASGEITLVFTIDPNLNETNFATAPAIVELNFFIEVGPVNNVGWEPLIKALPKIFRAGSHTQIDIESLDALLPQYQDWQTRYFTYIGSLAKPPCNEHAIQVTYTTPINLSINQVNALRQICDEKGNRIIDNHRPTQPWNNRQGLRSFL